jgi:glycosyltransferase involved in cell wall biosynthesis
MERTDERKMSFQCDVDKQVASKGFDVLNGDSSQSPLALIVDITCTTPHYDVALANALTDYPEVEFRASPFFQDRTIFSDSAIRQDLQPVLRRLVGLCPGITRRRWVWKMMQLHGYLSGCRAVMRQVRRERIPVLHFQWCKLPLLDFWLMRWAQGQGVRVVYTVHNALPHGNRRESVRRAYRKLYRQADALVVLSSYVGQQIIDWVDHSVANKISVIEHGILELSSPLRDRRSAREGLNLAPDAHVAVFIGRLRGYKGIADLIDAVGIVRGCLPKLRLIIAGIPDEPFEPYQAQIDRLGLADIVQAYPQYISEQFKSTLYAAADVCILPHRDPSQSGMGLEALAAGKPLIATRSGGLLDLVDEGINGYSAAVGDPVALSAAIHRFFTLPPSQQEAMAAASRALGESRFSWTKIARKHVELYRRLTPNHDAPEI